MRSCVGKRTHIAIALVVIISIGLVIHPLVDRGISKAPICTYLPSDSITLPTTISELQQYSDETITISETITIFDGGFLILYNCAVTFTGDGIEIVTKHGGNLTIKESILQADPDCSWMVTAEVGSSFLIASSDIIGSDTGTNGAITILTNDAKVIDCTISNFGGDMINIRDCEGTTIHGNTITKSAWEGINIVGTDNTQITNNTIANAGYCGIYSYDTRGLLVQGNIIQDTTYHGVDLVHSHEAVVLDNTFIDISIDAISLEYSSEITVKDNEILHGNSVGILSLHSSDLNITSNLISEIRFSGIHVEQGSQNASITENVIVDADTGVGVSTSSEVTVAGNTIQRIGYGGLFIREGSENLALLGNSITGCEVGIEIDNSVNVVCVGNLLNESTNKDFQAIGSVEVYAYLNGFCSNIGNPVDSAISEIHWNTSAEGNYWVLYQGEDLNMDGIGDEEYMVDPGEYDYYPLISIQPVLDMLQVYSYLLPINWSESMSTGLTTSEVPSLNEADISMILLANSIVQLVTITLILIIIIYKGRFR